MEDDKEKVENESSKLCSFDFRIKGNSDAPSDKEQDSFLPCLHGKGTDGIAALAGRPIEKNSINQTGIVSHDGMKLTINNADRLKLPKSLGVSTNKLLNYGSILFTAQNHTDGKRDLRKMRVSFKLEDYARLCGYDVTPLITDDIEAKRRDESRIQSNLKNARRKVNKDLEILYESSLEWKEKVKGKDCNFLSERIISGKGIKNGVITIEFSLTMAEYLIQRPLTQLPSALFRIDERNPNAYNIGLKIAEHYSMDGNIQRGTNNLLSVKSLLTVCNFPKRNSKYVTKHGWESRIKEPFECALDALTDDSSGDSLLEPVDGWYYCKSKGVRLTDSEMAEVFSTYEGWENCLIRFAMKEEVDHQPRLERKAQRIEAAKAKAKARGAKKKSKAKTAAKTAAKSA